MPHGPDFAKVSPVYYALTIPREALLERAVAYATRKRGTDAGETLADLMQALSQGDDWNLHDMYLLDETGMQIALGLIHHAVLTTRLKAEDLEHAVCRLREGKTRSVLEQGARL